MSPIGLCVTSKAGDRKVFADAVNPAEALILRIKNYAPANLPDTRISSLTYPMHKVAKSFRLLNIDPATSRVAMP